MQNGRSFCPSCGGVVFSNVAKDLSIEWSEQKKEFRVILSINCNGCGYTTEEIIKKIPTDIETDSICSCGGQLSLSDYSLKFIDNDIEFNGIYLCKNCNNQTKSVINKIKSSIQEFWNDTNKIEIGPNGLKFEKK